MVAKRRPLALYTAEQLEARIHEMPADAAELTEPDARDGAFSFL